MFEEKRIKIIFKGKEISRSTKPSYEDFILLFKKEFSVYDENMKKISFSFVNKDKHKIFIKNEDDFLNFFNYNNEKEKIIKVEIDENAPPPPPEKSYHLFFIFPIFILIISFIIAYIIITFLKKSSSQNSGRSQVVGERRINEEEKNKTKIQKNETTTFYNKKIFKKHNQELVEELNKVNDKISSFLSLDSYYNKYIDDENLKNEVRSIREKYYTYLNIKRFAIPIIGIVSVGKSTLLNYLLDLKNFLETGSEITTRFLCIIRHNINNEKPVISNITIEDRDEFKYNFEVNNNQKENENEFDKNYIKEYNRFFSQKENKDLKIEEKYFLLMEVDIPFFHGDFEKYADLVEFVDIPGLNEVDSIYFKHIIPFIQPNYLFSIFLFEIKNFQKKDPKEILRKFTNISCVEKADELFLRNKSLKNVFQESLFILNHFSSKKKNEKDSNLKDFKDELKKIFKEIKINMDLEENKNILEINLKKLNMESNKFNSFEDYLNYTIYNIDSGIIKSFIQNLNKDFNLDFNYYDIVKMEEFKLNNDEKKEINRINKLINGEKIKYSQYKKLMELFTNNLAKNIKVNDTNVLKDMIRKKIKILIDNYLNITRLNYLKKKYINYFRYLDINNIENNYFQLLKIKKKKISLENPKEVIKNIDNYLNKLIKLKGEDNNDLINSLNNKFKEIKEYSTKQFLSSLILVGELSSGKSSFINSLIGSNLNLLQVKSSDCSKVAIIVRYTEKKENISLYSAIVEIGKTSFYFKEDKKIAEGEVEVRNTIVKLNKNKIFSYYILYTKIQAFDDLHFELELKKKIELIDFPGLASSESNNIIEKEINKLLEKENAFIFIKNGKEFNIDQSKGTISLIYKIINAKQNFFNINNCLFVFTFPQDHDNYDDMEEVKKSLIDIFYTEMKEECMIKRKKNKNYINENKLIITKFDSPLYEEYSEFDKMSDNFILFTENIINNCDKNQKETEFYKCIYYTLNSGNYGTFSENYSTLKIKDKKGIDNYSKELKDILKKNSIKMGKKYLEAYIEYYLKIKENKNLYLPFKQSYYEETLLQLKKIIINLEIMLNETLNYQIHDFSLEILDKFDEIKNIVLLKNLTAVKGVVEEIKNKINNTLFNLNKFYIREKNKILEEFNRTKTKINETNIDDFSYNDTKDIFLKSEEKIINEFKNNITDLDIQLDKCFDNFEFYSENEINQLKNEEKFKRYFKKNSIEFIQIKTIIKETKIQIEDKLNNAKYQEYDYYDLKEYKEAFLSKPFLFVKGLYSKLAHNYKEDQKLHSKRIINDFNDYFENKKNKTLKTIKEIYDKANKKLIDYQNIFNSTWDTLIKNKKEYLDLSNKIINYLQKELYNI